MNETSPELSSVESYLKWIDEKYAPADKLITLRNEFERLRRILKDDALICYGAGGWAQYLFEKIDSVGLNIEGFVDRDQNKQGYRLGGIPIYGIEHLRSTSVRHLLITAQASKDAIREFIQKEFGNRFQIHEFQTQDLSEREGLAERIAYLRTRVVSKDSDKELIELLLYVRDFGGVLKLFKSKSRIELYSQIFLKKLLEYLEQYPKIKKNELSRSFERPNICLITMDTARALNYDCYGYRRKTAPFIKNLAENSLYFKHAYSTSNWTIPSHASIFSGRLPFDHGACTRFSSLRDEPSLLAHRIKHLGYSTYGLTNIPFLHPRYGFHHGFDQYIAKDRCFFSSRTCWEALEILPKDKPFFLFLNFIEAHDPYESSEYVWGNAKTDGNELRNQYVSGNASIDPKLVQNTINRYDDGIHSIDQTLSYYFDAFPKNTVFILTSDHGELFGEKKMYGHLYVSLHDHVLNVPLIITGPNIAARRIEKAFSLAFLYDVILQIAEHGTENLSFSKYLGQSIAQRKCEAASDYCEKNELNCDVRMITDGQFKLLEYNDGHSCFYKLPDESNDLSQSVIYQKNISQLRQALHKQCGKDFQIFVNPLSEDTYDAKESKKIEERLESLGYL